MDIASNLVFRSAKERQDAIRSVLEELCADAARRHPELGFSQPNITARFYRCSMRVRDGINVLDKIPIDGKSTRSDGLARWIPGLSKCVDMRYARQAAQARRRYDWAAAGITSFGTPGALSVHPVAASLIAARGMPLTSDEIRRSVHPVFQNFIKLPAAGPFTSMMLKIREGVLLIDFAEIGDGDRTFMTIENRQGTLTAMHRGLLPESIVHALPRNPPRKLCDLFGWDARSDLCPIKSATNRVRIGFPSQTEFTFADVLVPLDPALAGDESWRPKSMAEFDRGPVTRSESSVLLAAAALDRVLRTTRVSDEGPPFHHPDHVPF